jgi:autotransporter-associated beta strand protein
VRLLDLTTDYATTLVGASALTNVRLTSSATNAGSVAVNALVLQNASITGAGSLAVQSGTILISGFRPVIENAIEFGGAEGNIFLGNTFDLTFAGAIRGTGGVTVSGDSAGSVIFGGPNPFSGPLTINGGIVKFDAVTHLGASPGPIAVSGPEGGLTYTGPGPAVLARDLEIGAGLALIGSQGPAPLTIAGTIRGGGGLRIAGSTRLAAQNEYIGKTFLGSGATLTITSDANLGNGGPIEFAGGTLILEGDWTTGRDIFASQDATIDTAGHHAFLNGVLTNDLGGQLVKRGAGTLSLLRETPWEGGFRVSGGEMILGDNASVRSGFLIDTATRLTLDNSVLARSGRLGSQASVTLSGDLQVRGNSVTPVQESIGTLLLKGGTIILQPGLGGSVGLEIGSLNRFQAGAVIGNALGGEPSAGFGRLTVSTLPVVPEGVFAALIARDPTTGTMPTFARYDSRIDLAGPIGFRPLTSAEQRFDNNIRNPENGGDVLPTTNFVATGNVVSTGELNVINTLTLNPDTSMALTSGQTIQIRAAGVLAQAGGSTSLLISGGTLDFGVAPAAIHALGETQISSRLSGYAGMQKSGAGLLKLTAPTNLSGPITVHAGILELGRDSLTDNRITLEPGAVLKLTPGDVTLRDLRGSGRVETQTGTLKLAATTWGSNFSGEITGPGTLVLGDRRTVIERHLGFDHAEHVHGRRHFK